MLHDFWPGPTQTVLPEKEAKCLKLWKYDVKGLVYLYVHVCAMLANIKAHDLISCFMEKLPEFNISWRKKYLEELPREKSGVKAIL